MICLMQVTVITFLQEPITPTLILFNVISTLELEAIDTRNRVIRGFFIYHAHWHFNVFELRTN